jgi:hypothetical protein
MMEELLTSTKTGALKEQFKRYLPAVMKENTTGKKTRVVESATPRVAGVATTGDRVNRLSESIEMERHSDDETEAAIYDLRRLAGI